MLHEDLDSEDRRVRQAAAFRVLEYTDGKPAQRIELRDDRPPAFFWNEPYLFGEN